MCNKGCRCEDRYGDCMLIGECENKVTNDSQRWEYINEKATSKKYIKGEI